MRLLPVVLLALFTFCVSCEVFRDPPGPMVPDWTAADQAGNSTENQRGFLFRFLDAGAKD